MVTLHFTHQQYELLDASIGAGEAADLTELVGIALRESASTITRRPLPTDRSTANGWKDELAFVPTRERCVREEYRLEPGTGRALPLLAGQIIRIAQVDGNQCADLNAFNLHDYREVLHVGRTRTLHGIHPGRGDFLWSAPPRERAMLYILNDTANLNDTLFPRCSANMYESLFGFASHTNCADIQAEAQREYGLTPDDVHDSFNLFMGTAVQPDGGCVVLNQQTSPGDYVELLALMDVLVVPNVCGNDIFSTSNYSLRPLDVTIYDATESDLAEVPPLRSYTTQRTPNDFRQKQIRVERELRRDGDYVADFARTPVRIHSVTVELTAAQQTQLSESSRGEIYGGDPSQTLRDILIGWWVTSHA